MTLGEAIEEQTLYLNHSDQWNHERLDNALLLSIEAIKELEQVRVHSVGLTVDLLPGETKD